MGRSQKPSITVSLAEDISMTFRHIPAGCFLMGHRGGKAREEPVTVVQVCDFWMGETPVTQAQYRVIAENCLENLRAIEGNLGSEPSGVENRQECSLRPVVNVNWYEARVIARCLMDRMIAEGALPAGYVVDLPPEEYWEYACRAGTDTEYWSGDGEAALSQVAWYGGNAGGRTHSVREKEQPNGFGLHDMHGNVNEWCLDLFEGVRGRFRLPNVMAAAYGDRARLVRERPDPEHVGWAALFTRISGGDLKLHVGDRELVARFCELAKRNVAGGDPSWEEDIRASEAALASGFWPEDQLHLAEGSRVMFQGRVDSANDSAEPYRVLRGGSWGFAAKDCCSACRNWLRPGDRGLFFGFRLCVLPGPCAIDHPQAVDSQAHSGVALHKYAH